MNVLTQISVFDKYIYIESQRGRMYDIKISKYKFKVVIFASI